MCSHRKALLILSLPPSGPPWSAATALTSPFWTATAPDLDWAEKGLTDEDLLNTAVAECGYEVTDRLGRALTVEQALAAWRAGDAPLLRPEPELDSLGRGRPKDSRLSDLTKECERALSEVFSGAPSMTSGGAAAYWIHASATHLGLDRLCDVAILEDYGGSKVTHTWALAGDAVRAVLSAAHRISEAVRAETPGTFVALANGRRPAVGTDGTRTLVDALVASGLSERKACMVLANLMADGRALSVYFVLGDSEDPAARWAPPSRAA